MKHNWKVGDLAILTLDQRPGCEHLSGQIVLITNIPSRYLSVFASFASFEGDCDIKFMGIMSGINLGVKIVSDEGACDFRYLRPLPGDEESKTKEKTSESIK